MNSQPNILLIMTDQQQARACGREGFPLDVTPHQDAMARAGQWFDHAYTSSPLCAPARVSLLTGRFPSATGIRSNQIVPPRCSQDMIDFLKRQGYQLALVGKNHSHLRQESMDYCFCMGHGGATHEASSAQSTAEEAALDAWLDALQHGVACEPTPFAVEAQPPVRLVTRALRWIDQVKEQAPFFMWLSFAEPHNPFQVPEPYFSMFRRQELPRPYGHPDGALSKGFKWQFTHQLERRATPDFDKQFANYRQNYYGMCRLIDDQVARLEAGLAAAGVLESTVIFYLSDHGDFVGDYGLMRKGPELPESLVRIPFIVKGPGVKPGGPQANPACVDIVDVFPTICDLLGQPIPDGVQGKSLWPLLQGRPVPARDFDTAYCETGYGGLNYTWDDQPDFAKFTGHGIGYNCLNQYALSGTMRMVRSGDWKLIADNVGRCQLYNLAADPEEMNDLYASTDPSVAAAREGLKDRLIEKLLQNVDNLPAIRSDIDFGDQVKIDPLNYFFRDRVNAENSVRVDSTALTPAAKTASGP